jgi:hypothetical protein
LQRNMARIIVSQAMNDCSHGHFMRFVHPARGFSGFKCSPAIVFHAMGGGVVQAWITVCPAITPRSSSGARHVRRARRTRISSAEESSKRSFVSSAYLTFPTCLIGFNLSLIPLSLSRQTIATFTIRYRASASKGHWQDLRASGHRAPRMTSHIGIFRFKTVYLRL